MGRDLNLGPSSLLPIYLSTYYAIDYLWILKFLFWIHSVHWTYIIFGHFHVLHWHILGRFWIKIKHYKLKIKNQQNFKTKTWKNFQTFKVGLKLSQICQFMEKYLKIWIFFTLRKKNFQEKKYKISKFLKSKNGLKRCWICQFVEKYKKIQVCSNFEHPKLQNCMKLI